MRFKVAALIISGAVFCSILPSRATSVPTHVKSTSNYGVDSSANIWDFDPSSPLVFSPSNISLVGVQEVTCPGMDLAGGACKSGMYDALYQITSGPSNLVLTFTGAELPGSGADFGVSICDPFDGNTVALCANTTSQAFPTVAINTISDGVSFSISGALPTYPVGTNGQAGLTFYITLDDPNGFVAPEVTASVAPKAVPEPDSLLMLGVGLGTLVGIRRRFSR
jgi:hypothetical protein